MGRPGRPLAQEGQLLVAANAATRARTYLDLWGVTARRESRDKLLKPIHEYWEPLRFVEHAQLVAYCITICTIYDKSRGTLRLTEICRDLGRADLLEPLLPKLEKVKHLRDNIFAHRNVATSWEEAFERAKITADDMEALAVGTLDVVNELLGQHDLQPVLHSSVAREGYERLLRGEADQS